MTEHTLLIDLEGTLYTREGAIDGAVETIDELRAAGHAMRFLTNTDSTASKPLFDRIRDLGLRIEPTELFTPVTAASALLGETAGARVLPLTTDAVRDELAQHVELVHAGADATHVLVGDVRHSLDYRMLDDAFAALVDGAALFALQKGRFFLSGGRAHLDTGAIVAALEYAAGGQATVVGKPSTTFLECALRTIESPVAAHRTWVIGDDRTSDIKMGHVAGVRTVQVRTGKYRLQSDESTAPAEFVIDSIAGLPQLLIQSA